MSAPNDHDAPTRPPVPPHLTQSFPAEPATLAAGRPSTGEPGASPLVPGYEILGELGRGGMGVVYKARQTRLDRVVALKMILAGGHAGEAELARFRTEAQAIARLQHPNVVQIFEVSEHEGRPYFAMEFCAGGSLDRRLGGSPLPPREGASLVRALALAVDAAHVSGVIHRDLKPANVLLSSPHPDPDPVPDPDRSAKKSGADTGSGSADAIVAPKITDFGLAKKLDQQGLTLSGAIMGTPSYTAPEQAEGKKVGPLADVYSLGAILYECCTGRPPFRAATAMETLQQVVTRDPVPPRQLNPAVPRDLETIALKCLSKNPQARYATAAHLADDLGRFLRGEPIVARPVSSLMRAVKWGRRRPALAAMVGVSAVALLALLAISVAFNVRLGQEKALAVAERDEADRQRTEADRQRQEADAQRKNARDNFLLARAAVDEFTKMVADDPRLKELDLREVRREYLLAAEKHYRRFIEMDDSDPSVRIDQARAYGRLAFVSAEIGNPEDAQKQYLRTRELWQKLIADFPEKTECKVELADTIASLGGLAKERADPRAEQLLLEAHVAFEELARADSDDFDHQVRLAASHNRLGLFYKADKGGERKAERHFEHAIAIGGRLKPRNDAEREVIMLTAMAHLNLGDLYQNEGRYDEAEAAFDKGRAAFEKRREQGDLSLDHLKILAMMGVTRGFLYQKRGDLAQASKAYEEALPMLVKLAKEQPFLLDVQNTLASTLMIAGLTQFNQGDAAAAADYYQRASVIQERLYLNHSGVKQYRTNRLSGLTALAMLYFSTGEGAACEEKLNRALDAANELVKAHPDDPHAKLKVAEIRSHRRKLFEATGQRPRALAELREEYAVCAALIEQDRSGEHQAAFAACCCNLGNYVWGNDREEAYRLYDRGVKHSRQALEESLLHFNAFEAIIKNLNNRADYHAEKKRPEESLADRLEALEMARLLVRVQPSHAGARHLFSYCCQQSGAQLEAMNRHPECEKIYRQDVASLQDALSGGMTDDDPARTRLLLAQAATRLAHLYAFEGKRRLEDAASHYRLAIHHYSRLAMTEQDATRHLIGAGGEACNLANLFNDQAKQYGEALPWYSRAEWLLTQARQASPNNLVARRYLRNTCNGKAKALARLGRPADAAASQRLCVAQDEALAEASGKAEAWLSVAENLSWLGDLCRQAKQPGEAEKEYARAAGVCEKWLKDRAHGGQVRALLAVLCRRRAGLHLDQSRHKEAIGLLQRERELREELVEAAFDHANQLDALGECLTWLALTHSENKEADKAAQVQADASMRRRELVNDFPKHPGCRAALARSYAVQGAYEETSKQPAKALRSLERAREAWARASKGVPPAQAARYRVEWDDALLLSALVLTSQGEAEQAMTLLAEVALEDPEPGQVYRVAVGYALASVGLAQDGAVPLPVREKRAEPAARTALVLLERARVAGYFDDAAKVEALLTSSEMKAWQARADFAAWAKKLKRAR